MLHRKLTRVASLVALAVAVPLIAIPLTLASPAQAQAGSEPRGGVNGHNVILADHAGGRFERTDGQWQPVNGVNIWQANWVEKDASGRVMFNFVQVQDDDWSVYLLDASRDMRLQIDLFRGKIRFAAAGQDYVDLYDITAATGDGTQRWSAADARRPVAPPPVSPPTAQVRPILPLPLPLPQRQRQPQPQPQPQPQVQPQRYPQSQSQPPRVASAQIEQMEVRALGSQADANRTCSMAASVIDGEWTGAWTRVGPGGRSTCEMQFAPAQMAGGRRPVDAGPIWNQADAENKCRQLAQRERADWTGGWWTTQPGVMSVCELSYR